jgi:sulfide:quinone oxidoreductase
MPVKCGGAPVKIIFLSDCDFNKRNIRSKTDIQYYTCCPNWFPPSAKYEKAIKGYAEEKNVDVHFKNTLTKVDKDNRVATFKDLTTQELTEVNYDLLHIVPHQGPPDFVKKSTLGDEHGWVDVSKETMQHNKYPNIFALGDCSSLPTSKTAAAIMSQTPILVHNLS